MPTFKLTLEYHGGRFFGWGVQPAFRTVEQTLLEGGRGDAVSRQRVQFQEVMRERFVAVVENATGRGVIGFMAGSQQDPDMICEVFVLAPTDLLDDL